MGTVKKPLKAVLFTGLIYNKSVNPESIYKLLGEEFGPICLISQTFSFVETDYYKNEMGDELKRVYIAFNKLIHMDQIPDIKLRTNQIETEIFSGHGKRTVNIDPGYLTSSKVVLATTKNFQHRIYLNTGIYAEVTLRYRKNSFTPWEWTYNDYRRNESIEFFNKLRTHYRMKIRSF